MNVITYHERGGVERPTLDAGRPSYRWHTGYSEASPTGGVCYPWMTRSECQRDAKARGAVAEFQPKTRP